MKTYALHDDDVLPLVIEPQGHAAGLEALLAWVAERKQWLEAQLLSHGGLLLRGFALSAPEEFQRFCAIAATELRRYVGGDSPRKPVTDRIYTSTEYPSHLDIPLHNEMSYAVSWPAKIFFFCSQPPAEGGETPLAEGSKLLQAIPGEVRQRFADKGVRYVQNLHGGWGLGKSWQETFETSDKSEVERHCHASSIEFRWKGNDLWLSQERPAIITHPRTGQEVWFNQAHLWHVSALGAAKQHSMLKLMTEGELPQHAFHGDGSAIDPADLEAIRLAYAKVQIAFPWRQADILVLDNVRVAHGRKAFKGPRRILTAMA